MSEGCASTPKKIDTTVALTQALIPLEVHASVRRWQPETTPWCAPGPVPPDGWTPRCGPLGQQPDSVCLVDQKLPIHVPRARDRVANREIPLTTYTRLQVLLRGALHADTGKAKRVEGFRVA